MEIFSQMFIFFRQNGRDYKGVDVKNFEIISTVEDTCFFNIPEGEIYKVNLKGPFTYLGNFRVN